MRYILAIIAIILLTLVLWPWIEQFIKWATKKYKTNINFKQQEGTKKDDTNEQSD